MHVHLVHTKTQLVMAHVKHAQLVVNVQQLQIYQSHVKQENIGGTEINKYVLIEISVDVYHFNSYFPKFLYVARNIQ